MHLRSPAALG